MAELIPLVAIVGPTAVGKTALAVSLARRFQGEVVGADSRQVYRYMDIGTGKPTAEQRAGVPHHLIDVVDPDQEFSVAHYLELASTAVLGIYRRGRLPLLAGGSGHYVWALLKGLRLPQVPPDLALRRELYAVAEEEGGIDRLHSQLANLDPLAATRIDPRNVRRVVRAIEVSRATGVPFSQVGRLEPPPYRILVLGLTQDRVALYRRIDERVERMMATGWLEETRGLRERGYTPSLPALSSLGYRTMMAVLEGDIGLEETARRVKLETHRFVRRQYAWFRPGDPSIVWLDAGEDAALRAEELVAAFLKEPCIEL